ncbi:MAG: threonine/serine dehydratase [Actinobacteria bacterium]|nr:threonine/serine dehydratase [Actinomycetota bacterium]
MGEVPLRLADVTDAADRIAGVAHRTPVVSSRTLDSLVDGSLVLKCENWQRTGSFKFRGAYNLLAQMPDQERRRGVCTVSSGNHGQAVARAAAELGVPAVVCMPVDAPATKVEATRGYGAEVVFFDRGEISPFDAGEALRNERGLPFVSSHDDARIAAGAGTAALELLAESGPLDVLVAPIGGGGGMAGYATVAKAMAPTTVVVGAEPATSQLAARSLAAGARVRVDRFETIADGQRLPILGAFTFEVLRAHVDYVVPVADDEIVAAMRLLFERLKLVAEPSGAIALAAILSGRVDVVGRRVGVVVSGGNIGVDRFRDLVH